jgi:segregation and condensation protein B
MNRGACCFWRAFPPMSLKAKVEAVVYAAEEPVTLAQLVGTFSHEILEGLAEAAANDQAEEIVAAEHAEEAAAELVEEAGVEVAPEAAADAAPETAKPAEEEPPAEQTGDAGEKKAARQRDREIRVVLERVLDELIAEYANGDRGMEIRQIAGGYRMATKPEYHDAVRGFVKGLKPPMKLSLPALETLAVIAYKQPVTAPEVSEIRGVDAGGVLASLISRKLITTAGRKHVIGRPILYKTTKEFLLRFGLKDVSELPSMEEFEKMAGELAEAEAEAESAAMRSADPLSAEEAEAQSSSSELEREASDVEADAAESSPEGDSQAATPAKEE